jgi:hypothetical protein
MILGSTESLLNYMKLIVCIVILTESSHRIYKPHLTLDNPVRYESVKQWKSGNFRYMYITNYIRQTLVAGNTTFFVYQEHAGVSLRIFF